MAAESFDLLAGLPPPFEFVKVQLSREDLEVAERKAEQLGGLRNSIRGGGGNVTGYLGEIAAARALRNAGHEVVWADTYDYDLVADGTITIDVKTKACSGQPLGWYDASVCEANTTQRCDVYCFARVCGMTAWIAGTMAPKEYYRRARFLREGDWDPTNQWTVKADCHNVAYEDMDQSMFTAP